MKVGDRAGCILKADEDGEVFMLGFGFYVGDEVPVTAVGWIAEILIDGKIKNDLRSQKLLWKKKPQNFQKRNSLSWFWEYTHVLELEIMRLDRELFYSQKHMKQNGLISHPTGQGNHSHDATG